MPVAAGAGDADLLAFTLDVRGDEDQREFGVVIVLLQVGNRVADALGEIAVGLLVKVLVLEDDQAVLVEQVAQLLDLVFVALAASMPVTLQPISSGEVFISLLRLKCPHHHDASMSWRLSHP